MAVTIGRVRPCPLLGLKLAVRLKRMLLWKVRRRLIVTYLLIGLTPVVLLLALGALAATGGSSQAMVQLPIGVEPLHTSPGPQFVAEPQGPPSGVTPWPVTKHSLVPSALASRQ